MRGFLVLLGLAGLACNSNPYESIDWGDEAESSTDAAQTDSSTDAATDTSSSETTDDPTGGVSNGFRVVVFADLHVVPPDWQGTDEGLLAAKQQLRASQLGLRSERRFVRPGPARLDR